MSALKEHLEQAHLDLAQGNIHNAKTLAETLLETHPNNDPILRVLAHCHNRLGDHHQALHFFQAAYTISPHDPNLPIRISEQLRTLQRFNEAQQHLTTTLTKHPNSLPAHLEQAHLDLAQGNIHNAKTLAEALANKFAGQVIQYPQLIRFLCITGNSTLAIRTIVKFRDLIHPHHAMIYCQLAVTWRSPKFGRILLDDLVSKRLVSASDQHRICSFIHFSEKQFLLSQEALLQIPCTDWSRTDLNQFVEAALADLNPYAALAIYDRCEGKDYSKMDGRSFQVHSVGSRKRRGFLYDIANELALSLDEPDIYGESLERGIRSISAFIDAAKQPESLLPKVSETNQNPISCGLTQVWLGDSVPDSIWKMHSNWSAYIPRDQCRLLVNDEAYDLVRTHYGPHVVKLLRRLPHHAARADIIRLAVLSEMGGLWSDIDDYPLLDPNSWMPSAALVLFQEFRGNLGNNFIASTPHHPAIKRALEMGIEACAHGFSESIWLATGPGLLTRAVGSWIQSEHTSSRTPNIHIYTGPEIRRYITFGIPLSYKSTTSSWQKAERHSN